MKIYFVRHGHPDYVNDCLTELGIKQAEAASERLKNYGIEAVYSSTRGRALQTARFTADKLGLDVIGCDFMREIDWWPLEAENVVADGHPWGMATDCVNKGVSISDPDWLSYDPYNKTMLTKSVDIVTKGLDEWLFQLGYKREGDYYRVVGENTNRTIAMFGHGGSFAATLSHLFNVPFPQACLLFGIDLTSVVLVELSNEIGKLVYPNLVSSDNRHLSDI